MYFFFCFLLFCFFSFLHTGSICQLLLQNVSLSIFIILHSCFFCSLSCSLLVCYDKKRRNFACFFLCAFMWEMIFLFKLTYSRTINQNYLLFLVFFTFLF